MAAKPKGMKAFFLVWAGQVFSMIGTAMTNFAMGIWAWEKTSQATPLAMVGFFTMAPLIIMTPIAGVLVDRWNRKRVMAFSDIGAGLMTLTIFILMLSGRLEIWHLYITGAISGIFGAFQWPAYSAAISLMVPKKQYARTSGMISIAESGVGILAPVLAGVLLPIIDVTGIIAIDLITLVIALIFLLLVFIPDHKRGPRDNSRGAFFRELAYGFKYILKRKGLFYIQLSFFFFNFFFAIAFTLVNPMILASTDSNSTILGTVQSTGAIGSLVGALILTAWGGPKKKVLGVLLGWVIAGVGLILMGVGGSLPFWLAADFLIMFVLPLVNGSNQAIWQSKVAPNVQGRVFSVRRLIAQLTGPLSMALAGPLADEVFEPMFSSGESWIVRVLSPVFGSGSGVGMSVIIAISGILALGVGLGAFKNRQILHLEKLIPDHSEDN